MFVSSQDIDCMPLNPTENIPASLRRHSVNVQNSFENPSELKTNEQSIEGKTSDAVKVGENLVNTKSHSSLPSTDDIDELLRCKEVSTSLITVLAIEKNK